MWYVAFALAAAFIWASLSVWLKRQRRGDHAAVDRVGTIADDYTFDTTRALVVPSNFFVAGYTYRITSENGRAKIEPKRELNPPCPRG